VPLTIGSGNYPYINKTTAWMLLQKKEDELAFVVPPLARELFWAAYAEMQDLTVHGKGPGRITFVEPGEVSSNFTLMRQRLQSELYDGMSIWMLDNFTKGEGREKGELERASEFVRVLHTFTDDKQIPFVVLAHILQDIKRDEKEFQARKRGFIKYGGAVEQDCDFELVLEYDENLPSVLKCFFPKNREQGSGRKYITSLHVEPSSGYIKERT